MNDSFLGGGSTRWYKTVETAETWADQETFQTINHT